jgi:hypothetical protein
MSIIAPTVELEQGYEALRAQAVGEIPSHTPRGMAILHCGGMPAWMCACPPLTRPTPQAMSTRPSNAEGGLASVSGELVRLLAEMVLSSQRRCFA